MVLEWMSFVYWCTSLPGTGVYHSFLACFSKNRRFLVVVHWLVGWLVGWEEGRFYHRSTEYEYGKECMHD